MPPLAAAVGAGISALSAGGAATAIGASVAGGVASAAASKLLSGSGANLQKVPPPSPQYPALNKLFSGMIGGLGTNSVNSLNDIITSKGMPTNVFPAFNSMLQAGQRLQAEGAANVEEQFGASGLRFGTSAINGLIDFNTQATQNWQSILSQMVLSSTESAANRDLQASSFGEAAFQGPATQTYSPYLATPNTPGVGSTVAGGAVGGLGNIFQMLMLQRILGGGMFNSGGGGGGGGSDASMSIIESMGGT